MIFEFLTTLKTFYITTHTATVIYSVMQKLSAQPCGPYEHVVVHSRKIQPPLWLGRKNVNDEISQLRHSDYIESFISRDVSDVFQFNFTSITVHGITSDNSAYSNTGYSMRESHTIKQAQKAALQSARVLRSEIRCSRR